MLWLLIQFLPKLTTISVNSYEAILLGPGEKKIDVEVDTRKSLEINDSM